MNSEQNKALHALLNELNMSAQKGDLVYGATRGRTSSSKDMSIEEANLLIGRLREEKAGKSDLLKKRLIHRFCMLGYTKEDNRPDYARINGFITNRTGDRNPKKKTLNYLNLKELHAVMQQVEAIFKATIKSLSNGTGGSNTHTEGDGSAHGSQGAGSAEGGTDTPVEAAHTAAAQAEERS
jgi:hypothetical protein